MPLVEKVRDAMPTRVRTTADGKTEEATIQFEEGKGGQTVQDLDDIATAMGVCAEGLLHKTMTFPRIGNISDARIASRTTLMSSMEPGERFEPNDIVDEDHRWDGETSMSVVTGRLPTMGASEKVDMPTGLQAMVRSGREALKESGASAATATTTPVARTPAKAGRSVMFDARSDARARPRPSDVEALRAALAAAEKKREQKGAALRHIKAEVLSLEEQLLEARAEVSQEEGMVRM